MPQLNHLAFMCMLSKKTLSIVPFVEDGTKPINDERRMKDTLRHMRK